MALKSAARVGDVSSHGGIIISGSTLVICDGGGAARNGDLHSCPIQGHGVTPITGTGLTQIEGVSRVRAGDVAGCGAVITGGSSVVSLGP